MGESRDSHDSRKLMRGMQSEVEAEFESDEMGDTGGVEHQSRLDREGVPAERRPVEVATRGITEVTREQDDSDVLRVPAGEAEPPWTPAPKRE